MCLVLLARLFWGKQVIPLFFFLILSLACLTKANACYSFNYIQLIHPTECEFLSIVPISYLHETEQVKAVSAPSPNKIIPDLFSIHHQCKQNVH